MNRDVAKSGIALVLETRDRKFKSFHPDHIFKYGTYILDIQGVPSKGKV